MSILIFVVFLINNVIGKTSKIHVYFCVNSSGGSKGGARDVSPLGSKFFQFHAVFGKIWQNLMLAPPGELAPTPRGNPGSATESNSSLILKYFILIELGGMTSCLLKTASFEE